MKRYYNIELLRFLAAMSIVILHTTNRFNQYLGVSVGSEGGLSVIRKMFNYGVDMFFILTGIFIVVSTWKGIEASTFMKKKIETIYPLFIFYTLIYIVFLLIMGSNYSIFEYLIGVLMLPIYGYHQFSYGDITILPMGWTLIYTMFIYVLAAIALKINNMFNRKYLVYGILIFVLSLLSIVSLTPLGEKIHSYAHAIPIFGYYVHVAVGNYVYIYEFLIGIILGILIVNNKIKKNYTLGVVLVVLSLVSLVIMTYNFTDLSDFYIKFLINKRGILVGTPMFFLIIGVVQLEGVFDKYSKSFQKWGRLSYGIYVGHIVTVYIFTRLMITNFSEFFSNPIPQVGLIIFNLIATYYLTVLVTTVFAMYKNR